MKKLDGLRWVPRWVSHLGCVKGCLEHLRVEVTDAWLYGATGHAFLLNIHDEVCPSGPTAWKTTRMRELGRHVGYQLQAAFGGRHWGSLEEAQEKAWVMVREAIDAGDPCYGWELAIPEYYVLLGYDEQGYYFSGPAVKDTAGPKPWRELGDTGIGIVECYRVKACPPAPERATVRAAIEFALAFAEPGHPWGLPRYQSGSRAYDAWIAALEAGRASAMGQAYNAAVWHECREQAAAFLTQVAERLGDPVRPVAREAAGSYARVANHLAAVAELHPFKAGLGEASLAIDERTPRAVEALRGARDAEIAGLDHLRRMLALLG